MANSFCRGSSLEFSLSVLSVFSDAYTRDCRECRVQASLCSVEFIISSPTSAHRHCIVRPLPMTPFLGRTIATEVGSSLRTFFRAEGSDSSWGRARPGSPHNISTPFPGPLGWTFILFVKGLFFPTLHGGRSLKYSRVKDPCLRAVDPRRFHSKPFAYIVPLSSDRLAKTGSSESIFCSCLFTMS